MKISLNKLSHTKKTDKHSKYLKETLKCLFQFPLSYFESYYNKFVSAFLTFTTFTLHDVHRSSCKLPRKVVQLPNFHIFRLFFWRKVEKKTKVFLKTAKLQYCKSERDNKVACHSHENRVERPFGIERTFTTVNGCWVSRIVFVLDLQRLQKNNNICIIFYLLSCTLDSIYLPYIHTYIDTYMYVCIWEWVLKNHFKSIKFMSAIVDFYAFRFVVVSAIFHIDFGLNNKLTFYSLFSAFVFIFRQLFKSPKLWIDSARWVFVVGRGFGEKNCVFFFPFFGCLLKSWQTLGKWKTAQKHTHTYARRLQHFSRIGTARRINNQHANWKKDTEIEREWGRMKKKSPKRGKTLKTQTST